MENKQNIEWKIKLIRCQLKFLLIDFHDLYLE